MSVAEIIAELSEPTAADARIVRWNLIEIEENQETASDDAALENAEILDIPKAEDNAR